MAGTFTVKLLGNGQLAAAEADMYLVPAATTAIIKSFILVNTNTNTEVINVYIKKAAGTSRKINSFSLLPGHTAIEDSVLTLGAGDAIRGYSTTAAKVDFVINGVEET